MTKELLKERYYILIFNKGVLLLGIPTGVKEYYYETLKEAISYRDKAFNDYEEEINAGLLYISPVLRGYE